MVGLCTVTVTVSASLGRLLCELVLDFELGYIAPAINLAGSSHVPVWLQYPSKLMLLIRIATWFYS